MLILCCTYFQKLLFFDDKECFSIIDHVYYDGSVVLVILAVSSALMDVQFLQMLGDILLLQEKFLFGVVRHHGGV